MVPGHHLSLTSARPGRVSAQGGRLWLKPGSSNHSGACTVAMRPSVGVPALSRRSRMLLVAGAIVLLVLITGSRVISTYVDWLWFGEVGYRQVFTTVLTTRIVLLLAVGLLVGGVLALNVWLAYRARPVFVPVAGPDDPVARYRTAIVTRLRLIGIGLPVIVGLL